MHADDFLNIFYKKEGNICLAKIHEGGRRENPPAGRIASHITTIEINALFFNRYQHRKSSVTNNQ
jgi:hypothetical protein